MAIVVYTQYMENYGAFDADENSDFMSNYWKFKWGDIYIVEGTDERPANAVAQVANKISPRNHLHHTIEYVSGWEMTTPKLLAELEYKDPLYGVASPEPIYLKYISKILFKLKDKVYQI